MTTAVKDIMTASLYPCQLGGTSTKFQFFLFSMVWVGFRVFRVYFLSDSKGVFRSSFFFRKFGVDRRLFLLDSLFFEIMGLISRCVLVLKK